MKQQLNLLNCAPSGEQRTAVFSNCKLYRYTLDIIWDKAKPTVTFIGLNPSTADEYNDDPTLRRVKDFAKRWGFGGARMTNLFAYRATKPQVMKTQAYPISEQPGAATYITDTGLAFKERNDFWLYTQACRSALTVAAWGNHGSHLKRHQADVLALIKKQCNMRCLAITGAGQPQHPLFVPAETQLLVY